MKRTTLIGIAGAAGAGKTTLAEMVAKRIRKRKRCRVAIIPFAEPLKRIARDMGWNGEKDEKGRKLLQLLGTECGRECVGPDVWVDSWISRVDEAHIDGARFVIADDVRFDNEAFAIVAKNGWVVRVVRPVENPRRSLFAWLWSLFARDPVHASENGIDAGLVDMTVDNSGDLELLGTLADIVVAKIIAGREEVADG